MRPSVWTFPGQGSQSPGMGRQLLLEYAVAREILLRAEQISGLPLESLRQRGPASELRRPGVAEPLITAINLGYVEALRSLGLQPDFVAGYSAGEVAAYYAAGVLTLEDALRVAVLRGRLFENFTDTEGRMVTVSSVPNDTVVEVVDELQHQGRQVYVAAHNGPRHTTLVGRERSVMEAEAILIRLGGEVSLVSVSGMWHSLHLQPATESLIESLESIPFARPTVPLVNCCNASLTEDPDELRHALAEGVSTPVLWQQVIQLLLSAGAKTFVECGSGRVLFGLMRWNVDESACHSICVEDRAGGLRPLKRLAIEYSSS